jgi:hypothetical protein
MRVVIPTLALCLLLSLPFQVVAEESDSVAEPPWYEFELVIFQRIAKGAGSTEFWPDDPGAPSLEGVISFDTRGRATLRDNLPIPYRPLPASERRLNGVWDSFRNSRDYRPLYHIAWRQQVVDPEQAQALYIYLPPDKGEAGPLNPPKLEGRIKFGVKRYLHLETDLLLRLPLADQADGNLSMGPALRSYRMQDRLRMRSGKLHYLDHPVLGVLVEAERYEPPAPEPEPESDPNTSPAATPAPTESSGKAPPDTGQH